jgi:hypothetical protein
MHRPPDQALTDVFVVMPVGISCPGHLDPRNIRVPRLHVIGKSPRRFGNDLQRPRHRIKEQPIVPEGIVIDAFHKGVRKPDVVTDI